LFGPRICSFLGRATLLSRRGSTYPESRLPPGAAPGPPSLPCGDARLSSSIDRFSQDESHAKGTHRPCVHVAQKETRRAALIAAHFEYISIIAIRLHRQRARLPIRRAGSSRDRPDPPTVQSFKSLVSSIVSAGKLFLIISSCFMSVKHGDFSKCEIVLSYRISNASCIA